MKQKEARSYILSSILLASLILAALIHGPRLLAYVSEVSGYHNAVEESDYITMPATIGRIPLSVIVADTNERRTKGLSYRESLGNSQGMLFVFDKPDKHGIWMKGMNFPIDIIWIDSNLRVMDIAKDVSPVTFPKIFEPKDAASFVLEVNAGFSEKNGIKIGSELIMYR
jgi:uncharacterized membrane protein (UPF0127 family)